MDLSCLLSCRLLSFLVLCFLVVCCLVLSCLSCHVCLVLSCHVLSGLVLFCFVLSSCVVHCLVLHCLVLSLVLSCRDLWWATLLLLEKIGPSFQGRSKIAKMLIDHGDPLVLPSIVQHLHFTILHPFLNRPQSIWHAQGWLHSHSSGLLVCLPSSCFCIPCHCAHCLSFWCCRL